MTKQNINIENENIDWLWILWRTLALGICLFALGAIGRAGVITDTNTMHIPAVGDYGLRVLSPTMLEVSLITTKGNDPAPITTWNFVDANGNLSSPPTA